MSEYSPLSGTARSKLVRAELDEPCTRNRTGSGASPAFGAPMRLRQRLRLTSPFSVFFLAQYSPLQTGASDVNVGGSAALPSSAGRASPAPAASVAAWSRVRRAIAGAGDLEHCFMGFSPHLRAKNSACYCAI